MLHSLAGIPLLLVNGSRMLACAWSFSQTLRYRGLMLRRAGLGLAEPALVNRFTLWSIWMGTLTLTFAVVLALRIIGGGTQAESMVLVARPVHRRR